jgi:hypothetical protein
VQDNLSRAQRYRALAEQMRETARDEPDKKSRAELAGLADQYTRLADRLVGKQLDLEHSQGANSDSGDAATV